MRNIDTHKVNVGNEHVDIQVMDEPGPAGACHDYRLHVTGGPHKLTTSLYFQKGPILEVGTNGITNEALLAVIIDRLEGFQGGPFACAENEEALAHLKGARGWLERRTRAREARGVEGTHQI